MAGHNYRWDTGPAAGEPDEVLTEYHLIAPNEWLAELTFFPPADYEQDYPNGFWRLLLYEAGGREESHESDSHEDTFRWAENLLCEFLGKTEAQAAK